MPIAAATHTSDVFWFLPLFGLLLIVIVMFRWNRRSKATTNRLLEELERELATVRSQILLVTASAVPGGRTVRRPWVTWKPCRIPKRHRTGSIAWRKSRRCWIWLARGLAWGPMRLSASARVMPTTIRRGRNGGCRGWLTWGRPWSWTNGWHAQRFGRIPRWAICGLRRREPVDDLRNRLRATTDRCHGKHSNMQRRNRGQIEDRLTQVAIVGELATMGYRTDYSPTPCRGSPNRPV